MAALRQRLYIYMKTSVTDHWWIIPTIIPNPSTKLALNPYMSNIDHWSLTSRLSKPALLMANWQQRKDGLMLSPWLLWCLHVFNCIKVGFFCNICIIHKRGNVSPNNQCARPFKKKKKNQCARLFIYLFIIFLLGKLQIH